MADPRCITDMAHGAGSANDGGTGFDTAIGASPLQHVEGVTSMQVGKGINHKTMALAAADALRKRILSNAYAPGEQLKQENLAREFGMSRIPVREALLILEKEGLVRMLPHRGAVVNELTFEEIDELFSMRMLMEPWLLERSVGKLTAEDFIALNAIQDEYTRSLNDNDIAVWNQLNRDFHMRLYSHADSSRMMGLVANLLNECDIHTRIQLLGIPGDRERAVTDHRALLDLCQSGRHAEAVALLYDHIDHIRQGLLDIAARRKPEQAES